MSDAQVPDRPAHGFQRRGTDRWVEATEQCVVPGPPDPSRSKAISEKVELDVRIRLSFPKIQSGGIRAVRQNQRIIRCDVCDHPPACNVYSRSVQVFDRLTFDDDTFNVALDRIAVLRRYGALTIRVGSKTLAQHLNYSGFDVGCGHPRH